MILERFPEIQVFAEKISKQAVMKGYGTETYPAFYINHLVGYTAIFTDWPIDYVPELDIPYAGIISFKFPGEKNMRENGPIILGISQLYCDEHELSVGHEIGHILIVYYNFLYSNDTSLKEMCLSDLWIYLSNKIMLVNKKTGQKFSRSWFQKTRKIFNFDCNDTIKEMLCEEIGLFLIAERKRNELSFIKQTKEHQLTLF
jgi:hypothetical protein